MNQDLELAIKTQRNTINFKLDKLDRAYDKENQLERMLLQKKQAEVISLIMELYKE